MSAQAGTVPRRGISLDSRVRATARSEWIKFRSVRSGPFALSATALTVLVGAWLLGDANRGSYLAASPARLRSTPSSRSCRGSSWRNCSSARWA